LAGVRTSQATKMGTLPFSWKRCQASVGSFPSQSAASRAENIASTAGNLTRGRPTAPPSRRGALRAAPGLSASPPPWRRRPSSWCRSGPESPAWLSPPCSGSDRARSGRCRSSAPGGSEAMRAKTRSTFLIFFRSGATPCRTNPYGAGRRAKMSTETSRSSVSSGAAAETVEDGTGMPRGSDF